MKKTILLILTLLTISMNSHACDKGCTMGGNYFGILPQFHKHFIGLRHTTRSYTITSTHTHMHEGRPMTHTDMVDETYTTTELWGRFVPMRNVQIFTFAPYAINEQMTSRGSTKFTGLGDVTLLANYSLINTGDSVNHSFKHTLQVGGGVKLATGKHTMHQDGSADNINLQPGTGSTDYIANAIYTVRYSKVGLSNELAYRLNGRNQHDYKFGDRITASANAFYWQQVDKISFLPSAGLYYEHAKGDEFANTHKTQKGGDGYYSNLGLNMYISNIALGGTLQMPISSTDGHHATKGNSRTMLNLTYMF